MYGMTITSAWSCCLGQQWSSGEGTLRGTVTKSLKTYAGQARQGTYEVQLNLQGSKKHHPTRRLQTYAVKKEKAYPATTTKLPTRHPEADPATENSYAEAYPATPIPTRIKLAPLRCAKGITDSGPRNPGLPQGDLRGTQGRQNNKLPTRASRTVLPDLARLFLRAHGAGPFKAAQNGLGCKQATRCSATRLAQRYVR